MEKLFLILTKMSRKIEIKLFHSVLLYKKSRVGLKIFSMVVLALVVIMTSIL